MDTGTFTKRAFLIHGDRFTYDKTEYVSTKIPVIITCRVHGDFTQRPDHHLDTHRRGGCRKCYDESLQLARSDVINKFKKVHGDTYDYSNVKYSGMRCKIAITCGVHGEFYQTASSHLSGSGCPECARARSVKSVGEFMVSARRAHGDVYDYNLVEYKSSDVCVKIICSEHGVFEKTPDNHCHKTRPQGCPRCVTYRGFSDNDPGFVYIIRSADGEFMKIGLSNNPRKRVTRLAKVTPFEFSIIEVIKFKIGKYARETEKRLHMLFNSANLTGFDGCTEWFMWDSCIVDHARNLSKGA